MSHTQKHWRISLLLLPLVILAHATVLAAAEDPGPASGKGIQPILVEATLDCVDLGYERGFAPQPQPPAAGDYRLPDGVNTVSVSGDGFFVDWRSSLGLDAVIVRGGPNANLFAYGPGREATSDTSLHAPVNPADLKLYGIDRVEFCYDYDKVSTGCITVSKATTRAPSSQEFVFQSNTLPSTFSLKPGESRTFADQPAGAAYLFTETVHAGWQLVNIGCAGATSSVVTRGASGGFDSGDTRIAVDLAAGERVVCTFTNDPVVPPPTGVRLPPPFLAGGLALTAVVLLAAGMLARRRATEDR